MQQHQTEHQLQAAYFTWLSWMAPQSHLYDLPFAIPNGGYRHPKTARDLKAEGVKAGVLDVCIPVARGGFHGAYLEFKVGKNKLTTAQLWWKEMLEKEGYAVFEVRSLDEAIHVTEGYFKGEQ